jgi:hypothetical protein
MNTKAKSPPKAINPMREKVLGSTPAFPHPARGDRGVTYRAWLAVHAPKEIPDWFYAISNRLPPTVPQWDEKPEAKNLTDEQRLTIRQWLLDGSYDLPDELAWVAPAVEARRRWQKEADEHNMLTRYFTWPWHWADMMIRSEDQTAQANFMQDQMETLLAKQQAEAAAAGAEVTKQ